MFSVSSRCCRGLQKAGEAIMAGKDKGGRAKKTPASKTAKEKRQAKKDKKTAKGAITPT